MGRRTGLITLALALFVAFPPLPASPPPGPGVRAGGGALLLHCRHPRRPLGLRLAGGFGSVDSEEANKPYSPLPSSEPPSPGSSAEWDEISFPPNHEAAAAEGYTLLPDVPNELERVPDNWDKGRTTRLSVDRMPLSNWSADFDVRHHLSPRRRGATPKPEAARSDRKRARTEEPEGSGGEESGSRSWTWTSDKDPEAQAAEDLREAAYRADEAVALPLARSIVKIDYPSPTNLTALHAASAGGSLEIVRALLERGANIHARDNVNHSALHIAAGGGFFDVVEVLIASGSDIHAQNFLGETARDMARKTARMCANETGFLSYHYGYNLTKVDECRRVDRYLEGLGVRVRNWTATAEERMKQMMSQWDPVQMGYWTEGKDAPGAAEDETSDPPLMNASTLAHKWDYFTNLSMAEILRRDVDGKDDSWDTSGLSLKTPIEGPAGAGWRDPWGHDLHWWMRRERVIEKREQEEGKLEDQVEDGQESSIDNLDLAEVEEPGPWWDECNAEHEDRLQWTQWIKETKEIEKRLAAGETEEDIALEALAKGPPPPMAPSLMDKKEHYIEKQWKKEWETEIPRMMEQVIAEEDAPRLAGLRVLPQEWSSNLREPSKPAKPKSKRK